MNRLYQQTAVQAIAAACIYIRFLMTSFTSKHKVEPSPVRLTQPWVAQHQPHAVEKPPREGEE